jgi:hypothetical protein
VVLKSRLGSLGFRVRRVAAGLGLVGSAGLGLVRRRAASPRGVLSRLSPRARAWVPLACAALLFGCGLGAVAFALLACGHEPSAEVVVEPTSSVPSDVVFYAHVLYGGDAAYLVDGRWFRPAATGWVVFTKEPLELALLRRSLEKDARSSSWFGM